MTQNTINMKKPSPGFAWIMLLLWIVYSVISRYKKNVLYSFGFEYAAFLIMFAACIIYTYTYDRNKSRSGALTSFIFSLTFWIPLLNLIFCGIGSMVGFRSLKKIRKTPKTHGGFWFIIVCFILTAIVYVTYLAALGMCLAGMKGICWNIGLVFMVD
jgi:hypothetical protein